MVRGAAVSPASTPDDTTGSSPVHAQETWTRTSTPEATAARRRSSVFHAQCRSSSSATGLEVPDDAAPCARLRYVAVPELVDSPPSLVFDPGVEGLRGTPGGRSERLFIEMMKTLPLGAAVFDRDMRYVAHNRAWLVAHGRDDAEDLIGKIHYEVFPAHPRGVEACPREGASRGQPRRVSSTSSRRRTGSTSTCDGSWPRGERSRGVSTASSSTPRTSPSRR